MKPPLQARARNAALDAVREVRRGLVQVLTAGDPPPQVRSRRGYLAMLASTWLGGLFLLVALLAAIRAARQQGGFGLIPPSHPFLGIGVLNGWHPRTLEDAELLALLLLSVRFPLLAWRIGYLSILLVPLIDSETRIDVPIAAALLFCYWMAGVRHGRAAAWAMWLLLLLPVWLWVQPDIAHRLLWTVILLVLAVALDATVSSRRAGQELAAQVAQGELEEARRALLEERTRIAREMHDVVAHHMSMIAVQAETARYRIDGLSDAATSEFSALSGAAREGLTDLRRLLGVLRSDAPAEREPQPQLDDVVGLVEATRRAGVAIELSMPVNGRSAVSPAVGLCAYRVVQEALSNAGRHAPGAPVRVAVARDPGALRLDVVNGPPTTAVHEPPTTQRPGHGIAGMTERVTILGGSISARPCADGGFAVTATLPLAEVASE